MKQGPQNYYMAVVRFFFHIYTVALYLFLLDVFSSVIYFIIAHTITVTQNPTFDKMTALENIGPPVVLIPGLYKNNLSI